MPSGTDIQLSELMQTWLLTLRDTVRPTSFSVYQSEVQNHILPVLGGRYLSELSAATGEELAEILAGKGLSKRTVKDVAGKLSQALRWGVDQGYAVPILKETPLERTGELVRTLDAGEQRRLGASLTGGMDDLNNAVLLAWRAGLTVGELCALTWEDISQSEKKLTVRRLCQRAAGGLVYTEEEPRTVPLPEGLSPRGGNGYVVHSARGGGAEPRLCQTWLKRHVKAIGLKEDVTFAVLRNTYIRNLMEQGTEFIQVSRLSGNRDLNDLWRKFGAYYQGTKLEET